MRPRTTFSGNTHEWNGILFHVQHLPTSPLQQTPTHTINPWTIHNSVWPSEPMRRVDAVFIVVMRIYGSLFILFFCCSSHRSAQIVSSIHAHVVADCMWISYTRLWLTEYLKLKSNCLADYMRGVGRSVFVYIVVTTAFRIFLYHWLTWLLSANAWMIQCAYVRWVDA